MINAPTRKYELWSESRADPFARYRIDASFIGRRFFAHRVVIIDGPKIPKQCGKSPLLAAVGDSLSAGAFGGVSVKPVPLDANNRSSAKEVDQMRTEIEDETKILKNSRRHRRIALLVDGIDSWLRLEPDDPELNASRDCIVGTVNRAIDQDRRIGLIAVSQTKLILPTEAPGTPKSFLDFAAHLTHSEQIYPYSGTEHTDLAAGAPSDEDFIGSVGLHFSALGECLGLDMEQAMTALQLS